MPMYVQVTIDEGRFKYILLRLSDAEGRSKLLVRGDSSKEYHNHILQATKVRQSLARGL